MTRSALDRIHEDLESMPAADALAKVALWLEDCDDHVALGRPGGLPAPPFKLSQAWPLVRVAGALHAIVEAPDGRHDEAVDRVVDAVRDALAAASIDAAKAGGPSARSQYIAQCTIGGLSLSDMVAVAEILTGDAS